MPRSNELLVVVDVLEDYERLKETLAKKKGERDVAMRELKKFGITTQDAAEDRLQAISNSLREKRKELAKLLTKLKDMDNAFDS